MTDRSSDAGKSGGFRVYYRYNDSRIEIHGVYLRRDLSRRVRNEIKQLLKLAGPI